MKKAITFLLISMVALVPLFGTGCSGNTNAPEAVTDNPAIVTTWQGKFLGEAASGDLTLRVTVTVRNDGYASFVVSPDSFTAMVEDYGYEPTLSELPETVLENGENITGTLTFLVPPEAATTRVGYSLSYAKSAYNVEINKAEIAVQEVEETPAEDPYIRIRYYTNLMWVSPPGVGFLEVGPPGSMYLMAEFTVQNRGYASFLSTPDYFSVVVSSPVGSFSSEVEGLMIDWRDLEIQNNGDYTGWLAFPVSTEIAQSFYKWDYEFKYNGPRKYNIEWDELTVVKYPADYEKTRFKNVIIKDGENTSGTIAYVVTPGLDEVENIIWELLYVQDLGVADMNVQWANQTELDVDVNQDPIKYPAIKVTYSVEVVKDLEERRTYAMVDVTVENRGYPAFNPLPGNLYLEARY